MRGYEVFNQGDIPAISELAREIGTPDVVAELLRGRGRENGAEVEMRIFSTYWFENGKLRRRAAFTERTAALEAAGLSE